MLKRNFFFSKTNNHNNIALRYIEKKKKCATCVLTGIQYNAKMNDNETDY